MFRPLILLVDDFTDAREMYAEYLAFRGFAVLTAASGPEALALARSERPTLILMDIGMRGMTGTEAMQLLRAEPVFAGVPIIAFTAHAMAREQMQALTDGFDAVIPKPCFPDQLVTLIQPYLDAFLDTSA